MVEIFENEQVDHIFNDEIKIIQEKGAFHFSLDSILLAAWAKKYIKDRAKVIELCAGNCAATLYMSYFNLAKYDAIEIQADIYDQAKRSIELNQLENRINLHLGNVKDAGKMVRFDSYDLVCVNPPYFKNSPGHEVNPNEKKAIARHEIMINLEEIIMIASKLLKMRGHLLMVHRPERLGEIISFCEKYDVCVKEVQPFTAKRGEDANLIIIDAVRHSKSDGLVLKDAIVTQNDQGGYLPEINQYLAENADQKAKRVEKSKYYFYVLLCKDGTFYGGFTNDVEKRVLHHNQGKGAKYTKTRRPVKLLYSEEFPEKRLALKREYWFKHHDRKWKEKFLREHGVNFS
ncbi:MAG: GIY-YIG nuclease family protein [Lactobacillus sp.]|nr:GIY-YIG nuclease family protein [Lactobacillus sp.]